MNQHTVETLKGCVEETPRVSVKDFGRDYAEQAYHRQGAIVQHLKHGEVDCEIRLPLSQVRTGLGVRYYFRCPECDRRVQYLYQNIQGTVLLLRCRHCSKLNYATQQRSKSNGDSYRAQLYNIAKRVDPDASMEYYMHVPVTDMLFVDRPKLMRQHTYTKHKRAFLDVYIRLLRLVDVEEQKRLEIETKRAQQLSSDLLSRRIGL